MYIHVSVFEYVHICVGNHRKQKRTSDSLEMELQGVVNHQMWVLGTEHQVLRKNRCS